MHELFDQPYAKALEHVQQVDNCLITCVKRLSVASILEDGKRS